MCLSGLGEKSYTLIMKSCNNLHFLYSLSFLPLEDGINVRCYLSNSSRSVLPAVNNDHSLKATCAGGLNDLILKSVDDHSYLREILGL